jgi:hypothetical protein
MSPITSSSSRVAGTPREERAVQRAAQEELAYRDRLWVFIRAALACLAWCGLGLFCLMWSVHTTDVGYGRIAFYGGLVIGNGGILWTLLRTYSRADI